MTKPPSPATGSLAAPVPLSPRHDVTAFNSGREELDVWLKTRSLDSEGTTARTYVACESENTVVGYYCLSTGSVERGALPSKIKRRQGLPSQIPVLILGRLARDLNYQGRGLGAGLLQDALQRVLAASQIVGIRALLVHALDDEAASFWRHYGFIESPIGSRTFFLPIETIADALG